MQQIILTIPAYEPAPCLPELVKGVLPHVTHNIRSTTVLSLLIQLPAILKYELVKDRVPYDGMYSIQGEILVPDMEATIEKLQNTLYPQGVD